MKLNNLSPAKGSVKTNKRLGRGQGSGRGGTSTRGHKGAKSRSGFSKKLGFEGGQMPLQRRVPKVGFKPFNKKKYSIVNLDDLQILFDKGKLKNNIINNNILVANGLIKKTNELIKILGRGELKVKLKITANKFSKKADKLIKKVGGETIKI
ncbi:MAG: 50S ribosomal protein L15 [Candidatus Bostrichicola ureolyticus]|nr:MAG: 50S ribosomal protein L15 [Candidatus Bostrichicola ureolyticus]